MAHQSREEVYENARMSISSDMSKYDKEMLRSKFFNLAMFGDIDHGRVSAQHAVNAIRLVTLDSFAETMISYAEKNPNIMNPITGFTNFVRDSADVIDAAIVQDRDLQYDWMGMNMIRHTYSLHDINHQPVERPQYVYMRSAIAITARLNSAVQRIYDIDTALEAYDLLSRKLFTVATPTLKNAGTVSDNLLSCFIFEPEDDTSKIMSALADASIISKNAGGVAIAMSKIRAAGSIISTSNGKSTGIIKQLKMYDAAAVCWDQGGGMRKGAIAIYLEPWHADIIDFLKMSRPHGDEAGKCRNLFSGLWIPDLFIKRLREGRKWSLFSPSSAPGLDSVYGSEFEELYEQYEREGRAFRTIDPAELVKEIYTSLIESGRPYLCYKDNANNRSNQKNVGVIRASNLCTEIYEVFDSTSYACCTLASVSLPAFVRVEEGEAGEARKVSYDHVELHATVKKITRYLDNIIDINNYVVDKCRKNAVGLRPIGIGVQGLADVFGIYRIPYLSPEARTLDKEIFETIYHAAMESSYELALERGSYDGFIGSPVNLGVLNFDMWEDVHRRNGLWEASKPSTRYDWSADRELWATAQRNSLKIALMPTVSTSQLMGNNESFEPFNSNYYVKVALSGNYTVVNPHMVRHLTEIGMWSPRTRAWLKKNMGSLAGAHWIPADVREIYKTTWELPQKELMIRAAIRHTYVDQGQSLNIKVKNASEKVLTSIMLVGHSLGLKTGSYYFDTKPPSAALSNDLDAYVESARGCGSSCSS